MSNITLSQDINTLLQSEDLTVAQELLGIDTKADKSTVGDLTNLAAAFTDTARDSLVAAVNKNNGDIGLTIWSKFCRL